MNKRESRLHRNSAKVEKINTWFAKLGERVIRFRALIITVMAVFMVFGIIGITKLKTEVSIDSFFLHDDPVMKEKRVFESYFGNNDFVGVLIETDDIFSYKSLRLIRDLGTELKNIEDSHGRTFAQELLSITDFRFPLPEGGEFDVSDIVIDERKTETYRNLFDERRNLRGKLYSTNYKQAWIIVRLKKYPSDTSWDEREEPAMYVGRLAMEVVEKYRAKYDPRGFRITPTGVPVHAYRKNVEMTEEMKRVLLIAALVALAFIVVITRFFSGIIGTILVVANSILCVFGTMGWLGLSANTTFMLVPILLTIAVSVGYTIHISSFFKRHLRRTGERKGAVSYALQETGWPILFTATTTIAALLSFILVPIQTIRWVGITSATSIAVVYVILMLFYTSVLSLGKEKEPVKRYVEHGQGRVDDWFARMGEWVVKHGGGITVVFVVVLIVLGFGISKVRVDLDPEKMMGLKLPHVRDQIHVGKSQVGSMYSYDVLLRFPNKGDARMPSVLKRLDRLMDAIHKDEFIMRTTSVVGVIKEMNRVKHDDDDTFYTIPDDPEALRALLTRYEEVAPRELRSWTDKDYSVLRVFVEVSHYSGNTFQEHREYVKREAERLFANECSKGLTCTLVGNLVQIGVMNDYVTIGQIVSFGCALLVITIMMMLVFGSVRLGLIAMIPNVSPALVAGGLMGFMNEPLEFVTMTIAPMVLGLAVDDTIHFINHAKLEFFRTNNYDLAVRRTFMSVGKAVTQTTLVLCGTFLAFTMSKVRNMVNMGFYTVAAISAALIADFFVTPTLMKLSKPFRNARGSAKEEPADEAALE